MRKPMPNLSATVTAAVAALALFALTGCRESTNEPDAARPAKNTPTASAEEVLADAVAAGTLSALTFEGGPISGAMCFDAAPPDLAWFDVTIRANDELSTIGFELIDTDGVELVGQPEILLPANFGGRFDSGGMVHWKDRRTSYDMPEVSRMAPLEAGLDGMPEGQTGLVSLRLRLADTVEAGKAMGHIRGIKATWTDENDTSGSSTTTLDETFTVGGCDEEK